MDPEYFRSKGTSLFTPIHTDLGRSSENSGPGPYRVVVPKDVVSPGVRHRKIELKLLDFLTLVYFVNKVLDCLTSDGVCRLRNPFLYGSFTLMYLDYDFRSVLCYYYGSK